MTWLLTEVCLNGRAPAYRLLADDCCWTRHRRSDVVDDEMEVSSTRMTFGDRSFAVDEPRPWKSLRASIRNPALSITCRLLSFLIDLIAAASEHTLIYMF